MIPGLYYIPHYLTSEETQVCFQWITHSEKFKAIESMISRKVVQYGYYYDRDGIKKIEDIPPFLLELMNKERVNYHLGVSLIERPMEQLIINEYKPGQGIRYHTDHEEYFGPIIACVSIGSGIEINFVKKGNDTERKSLYVEEGSLYIMSSEARYDWKHGIEKKMSDQSMKRDTRYSFTFRTLNKIRSSEPSK
jgi:alkylated DNA repair dioxygenase AlkB